MFKIVPLTKQLHIHHFNIYTFSYFNVIANFNVPFKMKILHFPTNDAQCNMYLITATIVTMYEYVPIKKNRKKR